jgi:hypothetical protein
VFLITIPKIDLKSSHNSVIQNITLSNSNVQFLKFEGFTNSPSALSFFNFSDIKIFNNVYNYYAETILFGYFNYQGESSIFMKNLEFRDMKYEMRGSPIKFESLTKHDIQVHSLLMQNVSSGSFNIQSKRKETASYSLNIKFVNFTIINNEGESSTMIQVQEGSSLKIDKSSFKNNFSFERASIIRVTSPTSNVQIDNSEILNNAAIEGGVFDVSDEGKLIFNNSTIKDNFAIENGIGTSRTSGKFEINS